jgi:hypothetical protein
MSHSAERGHSDCPTTHFTAAGLSLFQEKEKKALCGELMN